MNERYADDLNSITVFPQGKAFRMTFDSVVQQMRLLAKDNSSLEEIRHAFSVENKSAFFSKQYGYNCEPRLYNINKFGYFLPGLAYAVLAWIKDQYGSLDCVAVSNGCAQYMKDVLRPLSGLSHFDLSNVADDSGVNSACLEAGKARMLMRDYQRNAVEALLFDGAGCGLIEIPTAGGKSFIISNFIWNVIRRVDASYKTLILVPNVQLVEQFYGDMLQYGFDRKRLAKFEGGMSKREKSENDIATADVIIANRQYVFKNEKLLPKIDVLVCDEVHSCTAESTMQLVQRLGARLRIGCSGTLPADKYQRNQLIGLFGKVVYREEITSLQSSGFISKLKITSIDVFDRQVDANRDLLFHVDSTKKYVAEDPDGCDIRFDDAVKAEHEYVSKWYKEIYAPVMSYVAGLDGNTLVLFDKIDVGSSLFSFFKETHPEIKTFYNDGQTDVKERESTRALLEESDGNVLFANVQILSTGVSIKRLHNLVFCFSSKSTVRIIQSCGRALRLHSSKGAANLYDVHFNYKYSRRHFRERLKLYREYYGKSEPDETVNMTV